MTSIVGFSPKLKIMLERVYEMHVTSKVDIRAKWVFKQSGYSSKVDVSIILIQQVSTTSKVDVYFHVSTKQSGYFNSLETIDWSIGQPQRACANNFVFNKLSISNLNKLYLVLFLTHSLQTNQWFLHAWNITSVL